MKKLFTSTLLTVAAVPFLMAAPTAAKKAQNTSTDQNATATTSTKKVHKKKVKKNGTATTSTESNTSSTSSSTGTSPQK